VKQSHQLRRTEFHADLKVSSGFGGQARAAGRHQLGAAVSLRQTGQRFTSMMVPSIMGTIADRLGVSTSFLIRGGFMLLLCISVALIIRRIGRRRSLDEPLAGATD
jgi:hypothetical protein